MMKISVPHNWQSDLLDTLDLSAVGEFYGKLEEDAAGGGRASNISVPITPGKLAEEVRRIHSRGLRFNYLLNAICMDNRELTRSMQNELARLVDWLVSIGVDGVTVTLPYMLEYVRKRAPRISLTVSTIAHVDSPEKARLWESLGADRITLDEVTVNRDFPRLQAIRSAVRCKLQLIVNNGCLRECPFTTAHAAAGAHASQSGHSTKGFMLDFYRIYCLYTRLREPVQFIRGDWIRPEDLSIYEDIGIDNIKLVSRGMSTAALRRIVAAYTCRRYDGNFLDLLPSAGKSLIFTSGISVFRALRYFFRPGLVNVFKLMRIRQTLSAMEGLVSIDNRCLDGFVERLRRNGCAGDSCNECRICNEVAEIAVRVDKDQLAHVCKEVRGLIDSFVSGDIFSYR
jgi:collagenase-like PrtC family protease